MQLTSKQKAIKEAYGQAWESVEPYIDEEDGSFSMYFSGIQPESIEKLGIVMENVGKHYYRPKSISNIETNNGWTRIEDGMPNDELECQVYYSLEYSPPRIADIVYSGKSVKEAILVNPFLTHWRAVEKFPPPVY